MKLKFLSLIFLYFISTFSFSSPNIGVVDTNFIFNNYYKRADMEKELDKRREELNKEIEDYRQKLLAEEKSIKSKEVLGNKEKERLLELKNLFQEKINKNEEIYYSEQQEFLSNIKFEIDAVAILIGKEKNLELVVEKNATIYGGTDITQEVLDFLNNPTTYKIDTSKIIKKMYNQ